MPDPKDKEATALYTVFIEAVKVVNERMKGKWSDTNAIQKAWNADPAIMSALRAYNEFRIERGGRS